MGDRRRTVYESFLSHFEGGTGGPSDEIGDAAVVSSARSEGEEGSCMWHGDGAKRTVAFCPSASSSRNCDP